MSVQDTNRPQIIVLTPVRNEAWVLNAFLKATSLWADYIIIADQMSTDGSREIYKKFPKVKVIDNTLEKMYMSETRKLLFEEAKKIEGDKILFALDADEFLSGDFMHTKDWNLIIHSKPDDCFSWRWMNLKGDDPAKYSSHEPYFWAVHVSDTSWQGIFPDRVIHEWRLPWPPEADEENASYDLDDFCSIHFAFVNQLRQRNKERFYQVSSLPVTSRYTKVSIFRQYHEVDRKCYFDVPNDAYKTYLDAGVDLWTLTDLSDEGQHYTNAILDAFAQNGITRYAWLDIWDADWCRRNNINNPQKWYHKCFVAYLQWSNPNREKLLFRIVDKILKIILK